MSKTSRLELREASTTDSDIRLRCSTFGGKHFQFEGFTANGFAFVGNGVEAKSEGVELEVSAQLSERFGFDFGYAYVDAEVTEDFTVQDLQNGAGSPIVDNRERKGRREITECSKKRHNSESELRAAKYAVMGARYC